MREQIRVLPTPPPGALAHLARAPHLQCGGDRFESDRLHHLKSHFGFRKPAEAVLLSAYMRLYGLQFGKNLHCEFLPNWLRTKTDFCGVPK
jgi:hypothetical protein